MLKIYNTLTRSKDTFKPIVPGKVRMYVCGMTVYDLCHLGHARVLVVFDVVARYLEISGFDVTYVRNITDVDDKIIQRAHEKNKSIGSLTSGFIKAMHKDAKDLGVLPPDFEPRATESMDKIIAMIETLVEKGYAYVADNGDVYYDVSKFQAYGKLSGKNPQDLRAGARVEVNEAKQDPLDFVLWKAVKPDEPWWESPWGAGRPGWHIECSAMSTAQLGAHFDIHGGGMDLQFPHHENEIAQSEACTDETFVNVWMHNGFVRINEEKMSKSLGNFFTVREVLESKRFFPEEVRYFILSSHYRSPLNYSDEQLENAVDALTRFYTALKGLPPAQVQDHDEALARFNAAMDDDFNTTEALAVMFELVREINKARDKDLNRAAGLAAMLRSQGKVLGLLQDDPEVYLKRRRVGAEFTGQIEALKGVQSKKIEPISEEDIEKLIKQRAAARLAKNWAEADRIRDRLKSMGIILEDDAIGTTWRR
ncbi:MAG: cysteine--tRNA ligase [Gammaproteobacteria bacterium]|nr:cysteine--tRNA ligase [Gammaproteobacteria bacterium]